MKAKQTKSGFTVRFGKRDLMPKNIEETILKIKSLNSNDGEPEPKKPKE